MKTVSTKSELKRAIEQNQFPIKCIGDVAKQLRRKKKNSKAGKMVGAALIVAGIATLPFTGGASATGIAAGASALVLGGGTLAISTAELAILVGGGIATLGILKGRKVRLCSDGSVVVE